MKKLAGLVALILLPLLAGAQEPETLLTPQGVIYTLKSEHPDETAGSEIEATEYLVLTTRRDDKTSSQIIPATLTKGAHTNAAMAFDSESQMLFVFWLRQESYKSELLFASQAADGTWSEATTFGQYYDFRENLRIAVTRKVLGSHGDPTEPGVTVHVVWWEFDSKTKNQAAQYKMLTITNGKVGETANIDLAQFIDNQPADSSLEDLAVLKQPVIVTAAKQDSVLVTFGDFATRRFHQARIFPVRPPKSDGRLRVPVGRREGGFDAPAFTSASEGRMGAVFGDTDRLAFYVPKETSLAYVILKDGQWSESRSIMLDESISRAAALDAIRRLVNDH
jgi:hypothetical protein